MFAGQGRGPAKGAPNAGRPRDEWKRSLTALVDRDEVRAHIEKALLLGPRRPLTDDEGRNIDREGNVLPDKKEPIYVGSSFYERALDYATEHGYGKAAQPIEHSGAVTLLSDAERQARLKDLMARAAD